MAFSKAVALASVALSSLSLVLAQLSSCPQPKFTDEPLHIQPGYSLTKLTDGLAHPRQIIADSANNLLVSSLGDGVVGYKVKYDGAGCPSVSAKKVVVPDNAQNFTHAILLSDDGKTLFASTPTFAFAWDYDAHKMEVTSKAKTIVKGMFVSPTSLSITRAMAIPQEHPNLLMVFRGEEDDKDYRAADPAKGFAEIKYFDWRKAPADGYDFTKDGEVFASGVRDSLQFAQYKHGSFWNVDNGADALMRGGQPVGGPGSPNPADELNHLGAVRPGKPAGEAPNTGFPYCHTVWDGAALPDNPQHLGMGQAFSSDPSAESDAKCNRDSVLPRLSIPPHSAPLGLRFYNPAKPSLGEHLAGSAFISYHGPTGHKVVVAPFQRGDPVAPASSPKGLQDFIWTDPSVNLTMCKNEINPKGLPCLSPVGLEYDCEGTLFVTSDQTGEVFAVTQDKKHY